MKFIPAKCPFCKGELQIPDDKEHIICMYCGKNINVSEVIKKIDNIIHPPPPPPSPKYKSEGIKIEKSSNKDFFTALAIFGSIVVAVILIVIIVNIINDKKEFVNDKKEKEHTETKQKVDKIIPKKSKFYLGKEKFKKGLYHTAKKYFNKVSKNDSNYNEAQKLLKICEEYAAKQKRLKKKYDRMFGERGWLHEKQDKLANQNFKQYKSGYEDCPDGSSQIAMYYKKYVDGYYVHVRLQYAYSMEHHYVRVWVVSE